MRPLDRFGFVRGGFQANNLKIVRFDKDFKKLRHKERLSLVSMRGCCKSTFSLAARNPIRTARIQRAALSWQRGSDHKPHPGVCLSPRAMRRCPHPIQLTLPDLEHPPPCSLQPPRLCSPPQHCGAEANPLLHHGPELPGTATSSPRRSSKQLALIKSPIMSRRLQL